MIFGTEILKREKPRRFHKFCVILTPFEQVYPKLFLSYAVRKCFHWWKFLEDEPIAIDFHIWRDKTKEKVVNALDGIPLKLDLIRNKVIFRPNTEIFYFPIFQNGSTVKVCPRFVIVFHHQQGLTSKSANSWIHKNEVVVKKPNTDFQGNWE